MNKLINKVVVILIIFYAAPVCAENWEEIGKYKRSNLYESGLNFTVFIDKESVFNLKKNSGLYRVKFKRTIAEHPDGYLVASEVVDCENRQAESIEWTSYTLDNKIKDKGGAKDSIKKIVDRLREDPLTRGGRGNEEDTRFICAYIWNNSSGVKFSDELAVDTRRLEISSNKREKPIGKSGNTSGKYLVPLRKRGGVFEVMVNINTELKVYFVVDSGAADVMLSSKVAGLLMDNGSISRSDIQGKSTYQFANGASGDGYVVNIRSLDIGGHIIKNVRGVIMPGDNAPLLLGQSALAKLGEWKLNASSGVLEILP